MYITQQADQNRTLMNWLHLFAEYDFSVLHIDGSSNILADALSRMYPETFNPPPRRIAHVRHTPATSSSTSSAAYRLPVDAEHAAHLIADAHTFGHFGVRAVVDRIHEQGFAWPELRSQVADFVQNCSSCQQWTLHRPLYEKLSSAAPTSPFDHVEYDFVTSLPPSPTGATVLLVVIDRFTSFVLLRPLLNKSAQVVAEAFWLLIADFGPPRVIGSDGERVQVSAVLKALWKAHGIEHRTIAAYNPRANGKVERHIATIVSTIRKMLSTAGNDWVPLLPIVQLMLNTKTRDLTLLDPFRLVFNRAANAFANFVSVPLAVDKSAALERWMVAQRAAIDELLPGRRDRILRLQAVQNEHFAERHAAAEPTPLPPGTVVMLKDHNRASKQQPPYIGVYTIVSRDDARKTYKIADATGAAYHAEVTLDMLKVLPKARVPEGVAYIRSIIDDSKVDGVQHFLIQFRDDDLPQWVPASDVQDHAAIAAYWAKKRVSK
jgi:hypothetical protein